MRFKTIKISLMALCTVLGTQQMVHAENQVEIKEYTVKQSVAGVGTNFKKDIVKAGTIPLDKTYAELTEDQKQRVKDAYDHMPAGDEPPFPTKGLLSIYKTIGAAHETTDYEFAGSLSVEVLVDSSGEPQSVDVLNSPGEPITTAVVNLLMRKKYKPAICAGQPCAMKFPLHAELLAPDVQILKTYNQPGVFVNGTSH